jgi:hypothetical protein
MIYDIFYVSKEKISDIEWQQFRNRFPSAQKIENVKTIDDVKKKSFTKFFWLVWDDVVIADNFTFDYRVEKWDEDYVHVFKNSCNGAESYISGITLIPKKATILKKEFDFKFYVNKKETGIVASKFQYPIRHIDSYEQYLKIVNEESKSMFWCVRNDINLINNNIFDLYFDPLDGKYDYDRSINHVFKNGESFDGLMLASKDKILMEKEFKYRFPIEKKEWDIVVSEPKPYDVVFISYNEINADANYEKVKLKRPDAKRVHGIKGIHNAHLAAAKLVTTEMFWVVDADAELDIDFNFEIEYFPHYDAGNRIEQQTTVWVWSSKNPVNDLVYGYGGVKLLPKKLTLEMNAGSVDVTTSISNKFKAVNQISNISAFNVDEFSTWRSAFRECVKLASKVIDSKYAIETDERLETWITQGKDRQYGNFAIAGAKAGKTFGYQWIGNKKMLSKINDFDWLKEEFEKCLTTMLTE